MTEIQAKNLINDRLLEIVSMIPKNKNGEPILLSRWGTYYSDYKYERHDIKIPDEDCILWAELVIYPPLEGYLQENDPLEYNITIELTENGADITEEALTMAMDGLSSDLYDNLFSKITSDTCDDEIMTILAAKAEMDYLKSIEEYNISERKFCKGIFTIGIIFATLLATLIIFILCYVLK